ncbi:hypothetical protein BpHYR1_040767 [Brachionus plicatilis]|uniref:Uncharacterized protein n=1 Tax=Brachionus plicatilis TaxID=10195 RepID=A0A3M7PSX5_BRAPC|nr:hypothetical protein BpHYR1_040767 [Brachionus plicatilis]
MKDQDFVDETKSGFKKNFVLFFCTKSYKTINLYSSSLEKKENSFTRDFLFKASSEKDAWISCGKYENWICEIVGQSFNF